MEVVVRKNLSDKWKTIVRVPYALRRVPDESLSRLLPWSGSLVPGDIALARVEKLGRNDSVELRDGRRCSLHKGDLLAVVFGNRYATRQFEGYARADGEHCDLLSMGGMCGLVVSKHAECGGSKQQRSRHAGSVRFASVAPRQPGEAATLYRAGPSQAKRCRSSRRRQHQR